MLKKRSQLELGWVLSCVHTRMVCQALSGLCAKGVHNPLFGCVSVCSPVINTNNNKKERREQERKIATKPRCGIEPRRKRPEFCVTITMNGLVNASLPQHLFPFPSKPTRITRTPLLVGKTRNPKRESGKHGQGTDGGRGTDGMDERRTGMDGGRTVHFRRSPSSFVCVLLEIVDVAPTYTIEAPQTVPAAPLSPLTLVMVVVGARQPPDGKTTWNRLGFNHNNIAYHFNIEAFVILQTRRIQNPIQRN